MRRDIERLKDIVQAATIVALYTDGVSAKDFYSNGLLVDATLRQLIVVGEAAFKLSTELRKAHPTIPWEAIAGFRHRLVHDYFGLDLQVVWQVATSDLVELRSQVEGILLQLSEQES